MGKSDKQCFMKNILIITPYFYPEKGGLENYALQIAQKLEKDFNICFYSLSAKYNKNFKLGNIKVQQRKAQFIISQTPVNLFSLWDIIKIIKKEKIDIIHAHTPVPFAVDLAAIAACLFRKKLIITYHNLDIISENYFLRILLFFYRCWEKIIINKAVKIIAVSPHILMNKKFQPYLKKCCVIYPGINFEDFKESNINTNNQSSIFMISNLTKAHANFKGLPIMLKAMPELIASEPSLKLVVAGDRGDLYNNYLKIISENKIEKNVVFLGKINFEQMKKEYRKAALVIVPSVGKIEGCPTVLFEAGIMGKPVVGSNIAGIPYIIKNGYNGFIVEPNNVSALAQAIIKLLQDKQLANNLGKRARENILANFTWDKIALKYKNIYDSL